MGSTNRHFSEWKVRAKGGSQTKGRSCADGLSNGRKMMLISNEIIACSVGESEACNLAVTADKQTVSDRFPDDLYEVAGTAMTAQHYPGIPRSSYP